MATSLIPSPTFSVLCSLSFPSRKKTCLISHRSVTCFSSKKNKLNFMDQILDYIEGGPKLRKWYGAPDIHPKNGSGLEDDDESPEEGEVRDAVLVTDGDNEIGQMVILSLIVKRARVKALVKDKRAAIESFGTYVESVAGDTNDRPFLQKALRGVRAEGFLSNVESLKGVQHVILLSQLSVYKGSSGIQAILKSNARKLAEQDESVVTSSGIPYTIIRSGSLRNTPGRQQGFSFKEMENVLLNTSYLWNSLGVRLKEIWKENIVNNLFQIYIIKCIPKTCCSFVLLSRCIFHSLPGPKSVDRHYFMNITRPMN